MDARNRETEVRRLRARFVKACRAWFTNGNILATDGFSNPVSENAYRLRWPDDPSVANAAEDGHQCGGCSFFAPLNEDWGVCCYGRSKHFSETVFEHFGCAQIQEEGWGAHSFVEMKIWRPG